MILTNLGNSSAGVLDSIRNETRIHWTRGLRQAELTILDRESALRTNSISSRKTARAIQFKREQVVTLTKVFAIARFIPLVSTYIANLLDNIKDDIQVWEESQEHATALWRDCLFELNAARQEKEHILQEHPEGVHMTYEQIQQQAVIALREKKVAYIVPRYWAALNGLPEAVGVAIFEASKEERDYLMTRVIQDLHGIQIQQETLELAKTIAQFPINEQKQLFENAVSDHPHLIQS